MYQSLPRVWKAGDQRLSALSRQDLEGRGKEGEDTAIGLLVQELLVNYVIYYLLLDRDSSVLQSLFQIWLLSEECHWSFKILWPHHYRSSATEQRITKSHSTKVFPLFCPFRSALRSSSVFNMLPGVSAKRCPQHTLTFVISCGPSWFCYLIRKRSDSKWRGREAREVVSKQKLEWGTNRYGIMMYN